MKTAEIEVTGHAMSRFWERTRLPKERAAEIVPQLIEVIDRGRPEPHYKLGQIRVRVAFEGLLPVYAIMVQREDDGAWIVLTFLSEAQVIVGDRNAAQGG